MLFVSARPPTSLLVCIRAQHHDNNEQYFKMPMGPRVLTFFLYLDPSPAQPGGGGETAFPELRYARCSLLAY